MSELHAQVISRAQAKALGMKHYFTGKPCKRGGVWYRSVYGGCICAACAEVCTERMRQYYAENREACTERHRRYREENHKKEAERQRRWRAENREKFAERQRRHYEENREQIAERKRRRREESREKFAGKERRYREENREQIAEYHRRHYEENREAYKAKAGRRRAAKRQRILLDDCELTHLIEREAYDLAADRAELTGVEWHVDHMLPMQGDTVSGLHHWSNLQVIPASLNLAKNNRAIYTEPFEWLAGIDGEAFAQA